MVVPPVPTNAVRSPVTPKAAVVKSTPPSTIVEPVTPPKPAVEDKTLRTSLNPDTFRKISPNHNIMQNWIDGLLHHGAIDDEAARVLRLLYSSSSLYFAPLTSVSGIPEGLSRGSAGIASRVRFKGRPLMGHYVQIAAGEHVNTTASAMVVIHELSHVAWDYLPQELRTEAEAIFLELWGGARVYKSWTKSLPVTDTGLDVPDDFTWDQFPDTPMKTYLQAIYPDDPSYGAYMATNVGEFLSQEAVHYAVGEKLSTSKLKKVMAWIKNWLVGVIQRVKGNRRVKLGKGTLTKIDDILEVMGGFKKGALITPSVSLTGEGVGPEVKASKKPPPKSKPKTLLTQDEKLSLVKEVSQLKRQIAGKKGKEAEAIRVKLRDAQRTLKEAGVDKIAREVLTKQLGRPSHARGKHVITTQTEERILTLKDRLIKSGGLTETDWTLQKEALGIKGEPKYVSPKEFISEKKGKQLISRMNEEAPRISERERILTSLDSPKNIAIKTLHNVLRSKLPKTPKKVSISPLWSMRYYMMSIEVQTGLDFFDRWERLNTAHLEKQRLMEGYHKRLEASSPKYKQIAKDEKALQRINDYIESKLPRKGKQKGRARPPEITPDEVKVAKEIEKIFKEFEPSIRLHRFLGYYLRGEAIPNAPKASLEEATRIYEEEGVPALTKWLETQEWGVIKSGYAPEVLFRGRISRKGQLGVSFESPHVHVRTKDVLAEQDRNILQRTNSYLSNILNKNSLEPLVKDLVRLYDENVHLFKDPNVTGKELALAINEAISRVASGGRMARFVRRTASTAIRATFLRPVMTLRNLFQNAAMNQDFSRLEFANPKNKRLSETELEYFHTNIDQTRPIRQHYMMHEEKPLFGFVNLVKLTDKISIYPFADEANRMLAFFMRLNRTRRAFKGVDTTSKKELNKAILKSGMLSLEDVQLRRAMEILSTEGFEAMNRYASGAHTLNVHFAYERAQRSPLEQGQLGRILGSLMAFPRSWGERMYLQARKVAKGRTFAEKRSGMYALLQLTVAAMFVGEAYKEVTGKKRNPYNPLNILEWVPGGIVTGSMEELGDLVRDYKGAITGDRKALARLTTQIPRVAKMFVPLYDFFSNLTDAIQGMEGADKFALKKISETFDKTSKARRESYVRERTYLEAFQKALLGSDVGKRPKKYYANQVMQLRSLIGGRFTLGPEDQEANELMIDEVKDTLKQAGYATPEQISDLLIWGRVNKKIDEKLKIKLPRPTAERLDMLLMMEYAEKQKEKTK